MVRRKHGALHPPICFEAQKPAMQGVGFEKQPVIQANTFVAENVSFQPFRIFHDERKLQVGAIRKFFDGWFAARQSRRNRLPIQLDFEMRKRVSSYVAVAGIELFPRDETVLVQTKRHDVGDIAQRNVPLALELIGFKREAEITFTRLVRGSGNGKKEQNDCRAKNGKQGKERKRRSEERR